VESELWSEPFCRELALRMQPQARLSTYAAGSAVRRALYRAGLQVGAGARVGAKREGTVASPQGAVPALEPRVLRRLQRDP
jgi:tRNA U34 5-methylaminomethyl-2-thiouridine-forming methyltransferase MnmC